MKIKMPRPIPKLQGTICTLRPINIDIDLEKYFEMNQDADLHKYTDNVISLNIEESKKELFNFISNQFISMWMIINNDNKDLVGRFFLNLKQDGEKLICGEGNRIKKKYWRKGYNKEARKLLFNYAFYTLKADKIITETWSDNINSIKSIEWHGFKLLSEDTEYNKKYDKNILKKYYELTKNDWLKYFRLCSEK